MPTPSVFFVIKSVNEAEQTVGGLITEQKEDKDTETLNYIESKPHFQAWSDEAYNSTSKAGQAPSYGNLREQHSKRCVGKFNAPLVFNDEAKSIWGQAKIVDDDVWSKVKEGVYTGFSCGGNLAGPIKRINGQKLITIIPREVSLVDNPAVDSAHFDFIRAADPGVTPRKRAPKKPLLLNGSLHEEMLFIAGTIGQKHAKAIEPEDAPQILGVPETATAAQAKAAWNKLLRSWHPDILQQKWEKNVIATGGADEEDNLHIHVAPKKGGDWSFQEFDLTVEADTPDRDKSLATIIGDHLTQVINAAYQAFEVLEAESETQGKSTIQPEDKTQPEPQPNAQPQSESSPKVETSPARLLPPAPQPVPTGNVVCSICSKNEFHTFSSSINVFGV